MAFLGVILASVLIPPCPPVLNPVPDGHVCLTGTVTKILPKMRIVHDGKSYRTLFLSDEDDKPDKVTAGDVIEARCHWKQNEIGRKLLILLSSRTIGRSAVPSLRDATVEEILSRGRYYEHLRIRGRIIGITNDEIDARYMTAIVRDLVSESAIIVPMSREIAGDEARISRLLHAEVEITGLCHPMFPSARYFAGPIFAPDDFTSVRIVRHTPDTSFDLPDLTEINLTSPARIAALGLHRLQGVVIATWGQNNLIVRDYLPTFANHHRVKLSMGTPLPAIGSEILAVGRPATDTYRLNLSEATYREAARTNRGAGNEEHVLSLDDIIRNESYMPFAYGHSTKIRGRVTALPQLPTEEARMTVDVGGRSVLVNLGACRTTADMLQCGCLIEATGICLLDSDNWRPDAPLPKIRELVVIVRSPGDITILARPPWWTVGRLFGVICGLLVLVLIILAWNRTLNRIVIRRSRELLREQSARNDSELRIGERTRLAVELHDTLSQNLIGVACQIAAAQNAVGTDDATVRQRLGTAERTLESCRTELRQVLSDLRSDALELPDFNDAIRLVLRDLEGGPAVLVRFSVPRGRLLDTTAHAILRIVRELAGNAVRHGHATLVKVAGALDQDRLFFSVRENGTGFDPDNRPGPPQGHFGLEGVRTRIQALGGTFTLESAPGKGSYAAFSIPLRNPSPSSH